MKIGFADYYLDNWHCNHYPDFLRQAIARTGRDAQVTHAFGMKTSPDGVTTEQWCREHDTIACANMEELVAQVDAVMVIAADDSRWHEEVSRIPLMSGKPCFVDKTFAYDTAMALRMLSLAKKHHTPVFSSSAQRYCQDILEYQRKHAKRPVFVSTVGPHTLDQYAVHQLEPIEALMGPGIKRIKAFSAGSMVTQLILDYGEGRFASFMQSPQPWAQFNFMVSEDGEKGERLVSDDRYFYNNLAEAILEFFETGKTPVSHRETLEIVSTIETAREARKHPDTWYPIEVPYEENNTSLSDW